MKMLNIIARQSSETGLWAAVEPPEIVALGISAETKADLDDKFELILSPIVLIKTGYFGFSIRFEDD